MRRYGPAGSPATAIWYPLWVNRAPKTCPRSGRDTPYVAAPTKIAAAPDPSFLAANTWTASTPVPVADARSIAHPASANGSVSVAPLAGVSILISVSVTVRATLIGTEATKCLLVDVTLTVPE